MPHLAKEAKIMLNNLIPFLQHKYVDEILQYFTETIKKETKDNRWDLDNNMVIFTIDMYLAEEEENELRFNEAKSFINK